MVGSRIRTALYAATTAVTLALIPSAAAAAPGDPGFRWDTGSLREVYNPPAGRYAYAPSVLDAGGTRWIWTCHNDEYRVIKDHIYETKIVDGRVVSSRSVLRATPGAWDSFHVCDPSVVAGRFSYQGRRYGYAMFYLGNDLDASAHNQIGVALAEEPGGPWVKLPAPIVTFDRTDQWGAGQPSAVSTDPATGRVMLFYTQGDTSTRAYRRTVDLAHADKPVVSDPVLITTAGLTGHDGGPDWLNGFDVALDRARGRVVVVREQHPYPPEGDNPWWIGSSVQVASMSVKDLMTGRGVWTVEGDVNQRLTTFPRNHNAGLARTRAGWLPDRDAVEVVFTDSCAGPTCDSLFDYDLWSIRGARP
jgi:hypothetical protein